MENYIVKVSIAANNEEDYETFKEKVKDLAKRMNINLVLNNECNCTSDYDENLCIRAFTCEDCVHYENVLPGMEWLIVSLKQMIVIMLIHWILHVSVISIV